MKVENLKEHPYISLNIIKYFVEYCGSVFKLPETRELLSSTSSCRQMYMMCLKDQQKEKSMSLRKKKEKKTWR